MFRLVAVALEVEVMGDRLLLGIGSLEDNLHVELAPSFLVDSERGFCVGCTKAA